MKLNLHDILEDYYLHGKNYADIARQHNCSRQYIQQICSAKTNANLEARAGFYKQFLSIKDQLPINQQIKIARVLQGKTQTEVAKEVGLALLGNGRHSKGVREKWTKELERLEIKKFGKICKY